MDPNATLKEIRELYNRGGSQMPLSIEEQDRLCDLMACLDDWLVGGGFLPSDWQVKSVRI